MAAIVFIFANRRQSNPLVPPSTRPMNYLKRFWGILEATPIRMLTKDNRTKTSYILAVVWGFHQAK
jgi:hypothetical protein